MRGGEPAEKLNFPYTQLFWNHPQGICRSADIPLNCRDHTPLIDNPEELCTYFVRSSIFCTAGIALGQMAAVAEPQIRITQAVNDNESLTLAGNVYPLVQKATASSPVNPGTMMEGLVLYLQASPAQEADLAELIAEQSDPDSPNYHQYLTPQEFAARYGAAPADIVTVSRWLESHGLTVEQVPHKETARLFSGGAPTK